MLAVSPDFSTETQSPEQIALVAHGLDDLAGSNLDLVSMPFWLRSAEPAIALPAAAPTGYSSPSCWTTCPPRTRARARLPPRRRLALHRTSGPLPGSTVTLPY